MSGWVALLAVFSALVTVALAMWYLAYLADLASRLVWSGLSAVNQSQDKRIAATRATSVPPSPSVNDSIE